MTGQLRMTIQLTPSDDIEALIGQLEALGADVSDTTRRGLGPEAAASLAVSVPAGLALLTTCINQVVHSWKDRHGFLIDAGGEGPPTIQPLPGAPFGTVVVIERDGSKVERSDLTSDDAVKYAAQAIDALRPKGQST